MSRAAATRRRSEVEPQLLVALLWAASRLVLVAVLLLVIADGRRAADALRGWDAAIYIRLAEQGYTQPNDHAFFPGLPFVLGMVHTLGVDTALAGALVSLVCSALAAWALYRLGSEGWGLGGPRDQPMTGVIAAGLWLLAPTSVFTSVAYTEAPFCAAAFWAWQRARENRWAQASVLAGLACTLRISGLFLVGALLVLAIVGNGDDDRLQEDWSLRLRDAAWLLLPVAVLAGYVVYLHGQTGSWTAWLQAQQAGWGREFTSVPEAFKNTWEAAKPSRWPDRKLVAPVFLAEIISMLVGVVITVLSLVRRRWAEASWVAVQLVAFGTSHWYMSVNRAVLLWFPLFLALAALLGRPYQRGRRRGGGFEMLALGALAAGMGLFAIAWAWLYYTGQWAS